MNDLLIQKVFFGMLALVSAACWALGAVLWKKLDTQISPLGMNLAKAVIGSLYLAAIFLVIKIQPPDTRSLLFLALSGVVGIALGDTFFFASLTCLGPRLTSLTGSLTPVAIALSAALFLNERPSLLAWTGIITTTAGVAWILNERLPADTIVKNKPLGVIYRSLAILCTAAGVILAKIGVADVPATEATLVRMLSSIPALLLWACLSRQFNRCVGPFKDPALLKKTALIVFIVVFGGFWLSLLALKHIDASIAGTLNATAPLFILPIVAVVLKEKITARAAMGSVIAVAGVGMILIGG